MNYVDQNSYQQSSKYIENLSNEYKGNLFEYLVAEELSQLFHLQHKFYTNVPESYRKVLQNYSQNLKKINEETLKALPLLAKKVASEIATNLTHKPEDIFLLGKIENEYNEADILLITENMDKLPLSLKLCKDNSYINTKSGGIKSFFAKYFSTFPEADLIQILLDKKITTEFQTMVTTLASELAIETDSVTKLKEALISKGISLLPGELPSDLQKIVLDYYYAIANFIYDKMYELYGKDKQKFLDSLLPLWGMSKESLLQVFVLHDQYKLKSIKIQNQLTIEENLYALEFLKAENSHKSFFEMVTKQFIFQIRVKPMNEYLVPSLKVNCSLKVRCDK